MCDKDRLRCRMLPSKRFSISTVTKGIKWENLIDGNTYFICVAAHECLKNEFNSGGVDCE